MIHIALEGVDGCGKTTQYQLALEKLVDEGYDVGEFRYSAKDNFWGRSIKKIYALDAPPIMHYVSNPRVIQEFMYAMSARSNGKKIPAGKDIILADRSILTAYASHYGRVPLPLISLMEPTIIPDMIIYLDVDIKEAHKRISGREQLLKDEEYHALVQFKESYDRLIKNPPRNIANADINIVDANRPIRELHEEIYAIIKRSRQ